MSEPIMIYMHRLFGGPCDGEEVSGPRIYEKLRMGGPTPGNLVDAFAKAGHKVYPPGTPFAVYIRDDSIYAGSTKTRVWRMDVESGDSFEPPLECVAMRFSGYENSDYDSDLGDAK